VPDLLAEPVAADVRFVYAVRLMARAVVLAPGPQEQEAGGAGHDPLRQRRPDLDLSSVASFVRSRYCQRCGDVSSFSTLPTRMTLPSRSAFWSACASSHRTPVSGDQVAQQVPVAVQLDEQLVVLVVRERPCGASSNSASA
jgi:hypothetical protein